MAKRTLLAVRHADGHLELLEPLELPVGAKVPITVDVPEPAPRAQVELPTRNLGPQKGDLSREDIYGDVA